MYQLFFLITTGILSLLFACLLLQALASETGISWHVRVSVVIAWFSSFYIVILLPADIATTLTHGEEVSSLSYVVMWRILYWTTQVETWVLLTNQSYYVQAGEFSVKDKLRRVLRDNARRYLIVAILGLVGLVFILIHYQNIHAVTSYLLLLGRTWGLLLCILLLGYGCVDLPKSMWRWGDAEYHLRSCYVRMTRADANVVDTKTALAVQMNRTLSADRALGENHPLRQYIVKIIRKFPVGFNLVAASNLLDRTELRKDWKPNDLTYENLATLHRDLKAAVTAYQRAEYEWNSLLREAFEAEDVVTNQQNPSRRFRSTLRPPGNAIKETVEWWWKVRFRRPVGRLLSILLGSISVVVVWSELTLFVSHTKGDLSLSPFAYMVNASSSSYLLSQVVSFWPLAYMCICAYYSIFKLKLFSLYQLHFGHNTDAYSLLFNAAYLSRLSAPLCYNYISMIHLSAGNPTAFEQVMGPSYVSDVGGAFNISIPVLIALFCILNVFNVIPYLLDKLGLSKYYYDDEMQDEQIQEGIRLLAHARRQRERQQSGSSIHSSPSPPPLNMQRERKSPFAQLFGGRNSSHQQHSETQSLLYASEDQNSPSSETSSSSHHHHQASPSAVTNFFTRMTGLVTGRSNGYQSISLSGGRV
mmetsp:Transcript_25244/g.41537  ORF Transcript_25244/g.41537 Transcript_25244/m.41537 type:complete len:643 (-) Transcript_25244:160-2088(-)